MFQTIGNIMTCQGGIQLLEGSAGRIYTYVYFDFLGYTYYYILLHLKLFQIYIFFADFADHEW